MGHIDFYANVFDSSFIYRLVHYAHQIIHFVHF